MKKKGSLEKAPVSVAPPRLQMTEVSFKSVGIEEREIDQILADSFPASDAPPWTLGVPETPPKLARKRKGRLG